MGEFEIQRTKLMIFVEKLAFLGEWRKISNGASKTLQTLNLIRSCARWLPYIHTRSNVVLCPHD